jgi:hypothetical protein
MNTDKELKPILTWFSSDIEPDDVEFEWEYLLGQLDELIQEVNPKGYWYCDVKNFGWRKLSGYSYLEFETASEMLSKVLPKTDCSFNVFREGKNLKIQNYHHDSVSGSEWYELSPISQDEFENQSM